MRCHEGEIHETFCPIYSTCHAFCAADAAFSVRLRRYRAVHIPDANPYRNADGDARANAETNAHTGAHTGAHAEPDTGTEFRGFCAGSER